MTKHMALDNHILNIVRKHDIPEQSDLQNFLKEIGYDIPQATLSRRLKKLKIAKIDGVYKVIDTATQNLPPILNVQLNDAGLIVLHTHPGHASSLAYFLDQKYVFTGIKKDFNALGLLGTIAGDDTVLLISKNRETGTAIVTRLQELFPYLR